jgi:hypothetical protein
MKKLILVRHAKSDWPEETEDFDRPLADKGLEEAMHMSRFMKNNNVAIDYFVSSPAVRALNTCKIFNQTYQISINTNEKLYNPSESNFESVIYDLDDSHESVAFSLTTTEFPILRILFPKIFSIFQPAVLPVSRSTAIHGRNSTEPKRNCCFSMIRERLNK